MNKKISFGAALALLLIVAAFVFSLTMMYATESTNSRIRDLRSRERMYEKFSEIDGLVRVNYHGQIIETQLNDSIASGYLSGVGDQYCRYISAEEYKRLTQDTEGENVGIGAVIEIAPDDFYLLVKEVYPDSPAEVAGIQAGDLIVKVDDTDLSRENSRQVLESISGPAGSTITLVTRRGSVESGQLEMTRRAVAVPTVVYCRLLEDSTVGYMYISEFADRTYDQFNREMLRLIDAGATSLIIDVRDNQSDGLKSTTRILDRLLPAGVLASAQYKDGTVEVLADSDANEIDLPLVVLTNAGTTGTAELFAQSIKDFEKGRTVGTTTAGKGVVQNIFQLSDGSAIELSVAYYLTKSGQTYHDTGVRADFEVSMDSDWANLLELESADAQLVKAKEVAIGMQRTTDSDSAESPADTTTPTAVPDEDPVPPSDEEAPDTSEEEDTPPDDEGDGTEDTDGASDEEDTSDSEDESTAPDEEEE